MRAAELGVWVRENGRTRQELDTDFELMGEADKETAKQRARFIIAIQDGESCTYVALSLGRPRKGCWRVCGERCHITIGYVARMDGRGRLRLQEILVWILNEWRWRDPASRPRAVVRFRKFELQTPEDKSMEKSSSLDLSACRRGPVAMMGTQKVTQLLQEERVYVHSLCAGGQHT